MGRRTEFHDPDWRDEEQDFFPSTQVGLSRRKALFWLTVPRGEGIVKLTGATAITEMDLDDAEELLRVLGDAVEFLRNNPNHTNDFRS